ncbi:MAG: C-terminal binding protein [Peptostreptococcaceae bacterium]|nr:C-terminal binding protein [Peptostreptococcaceae bacterium]
MSKFRVLITDHEYKTINNEIRILNELEDVEVIDLHSRDEDTIINIARDCDAIIVQFAHINEKVINSLNKCKIIAKYAIGYDGIDVDAATRKNIYVTNLHDYCSDEVSTHAIALLMQAARRTSEFGERVSRGEWYGMGIKFQNLQNCTVGVISYGRIARKFVHKCKPFCKEILVYDKYDSDYDILEQGAIPSGFENIIKNSDYISIHSSLTPETKHMFNKKVFRKMKSTASIINVARGELISTEDLIWALENKEIAYAALDVLEVEPPKKDLPLLSMENVIITPHTAWYSEESQRILQSTPAEEVVRVLSGGKPINLVNKEMLLS